MKNEEKFKEFVRGVHERLEQGEEKYKDRIEGIASAAVVYELEQEFLDIMGWGFEIWRRFQVFKEKLEKWENDTTV